MLAILDKQMHKEISLPKALSLSEMSREIHIKKIINYVFLSIAKTTIYAGISGLKANINIF